MRIAVCDDDQAIREELIQLIQKQVSDVDIVRYQSKLYIYAGVPEREIWKRSSLGSMGNILLFYPDYSI